MFTKTEILPKKANLLIVDDYLDNLRSLSSILSQNGYKVRKAISGQMALQTIQSEIPDLILLDVNMPDMDGYAVCAALKASPRTCQIPIIFLSALDDVTDKVRAFAVGGADYITKPFQADEVLTRINYQLQIQRQQQQIAEHNQKLQQEIQQRIQAETETQLLLTTIHAVHQAADFNDALEVLLCKIRQAIGWDYGEAWVLEPNRTNMKLSQTSYNKFDLLLKQFHQASTNLTITHHVGLPGLVWAVRQPKWIEDVSLLPIPTFLRSQAAANAELKAGFSIPIILKKHLIAVLVFFKRSPQPYDAKIIQLVQAIALELAEFMQRQKVQEALIMANKELKRLTILDGLTQIANRRHFNETLTKEWQRHQRRQSPISLILCDIDHFKQYNDYYGHLAGDSCLKQVAQTIANSCKRSADLAARYGGEEFTIILPNTDLAGAICLAQLIQQAIAHLAIRHEKSATHQFITLSMGISSLIPQVKFSPEYLISTADQALYTAKAQGRNTYRVAQ
ncbi:diguanylate cyclase domain-containing protein [Nostoc sp. TCL26-01]|uniref:diguanylate cyclase domain-containing protein n=1 Tax=Nostoc sp. TCL26-01 TaxID=2576904 RepID=UPI0021178741|nr:diguanylate cyclase [Nostoc sp. TCL26-01]